MHAANSFDAAHPLLEYDWNTNIVFYALAIDYYMHRFQFILSSEMFDALQKLDSLYLDFASNTFRPWIVLEEAQKFFISIYD